jgi:glyoxylase-like metal-dependent hydrolase (beta-lactamase superfamily II)
MRLYVFDGGTLESDPARYQLKKEEVAATQLSVTAFLVVHPRGTLMWDTGAVSDDTWTPTGGPVERQVILSDYRERPITVRQPLKAQLASAGYRATDITYLALSHYHWDHTANANAFANATWLVRKVERDEMFPATPPQVAQPSTFAALHASRFVIITADQYDVFGDGTVIILSTPGHTPGHQSLYVKLPNTGGVVLSGDLYHYPEERSLSRWPPSDANIEQLRTSRDALEGFLKRTGARLWIQHDLTASARLKKAPDYYR